MTNTEREALAKKLYSISGYDVWKGYGVWKDTGTFDKQSFLLQSKFILKNIEIVKCDLPEWVNTEWEKYAWTSACNKIRDVLVLEKPTETPLGIRYRK